MKYKCYYYIHISLLLHNIIINEHQSKYSSSVGGSIAKYWAVWLLYKHVWQFVRIVAVLYIDTTSWSKSFWFFLKSRNANVVITLPKPHSTACLTELIRRLTISCSGVNILFVYGFSNSSRIGYAASSYNTKFAFGYDAHLSN